MPSIIVTRFLFPYKLLNEFDKKISEAEILKRKMKYFLSQTCKHSQSYIWKYFS